MSCPDPLYDYEDFDMDRDNFYGESMDYEDYNDDAGDDEWHDDDEDNDSMDGDTESALSSAGWGTDEDYGYYGEDVDYREDFHSDESVGYVDYNEDGPYYD